MGEYREAARRVISRWPMAVWLALATARLWHTGAGSDGPRDTARHDAIQHGRPGGALRRASFGRQRDATTGTCDRGLRGAQGLERGLDVAPGLLAAGENNGGARLRFVGDERLRQEPFA